MGADLVAVEGCRLSDKLGFPAREVVVDRAPGGAARSQHVGERHPGGAPLLQRLDRGIDHAHSCTGRHPRSLPLTSTTILLHGSQRLVRPY